MTTSSGLVRFDGGRFREFNQANTPGLTAEGFSFYALMEDRQGCLWAGTWTAGAVRYCHGVFTTFTVKDGLPGNRVVRIDEDEEGTIWFFTDPGLAKWKDGRISRVAPEPGSPFNDVLVAPKDKVGVDGYLFGLWRIGKNGWERFARGHWCPFPVPSGTGDGSDLRVASMVEDSKGRLWYRFRHDFATYYCLNQGQLTIYSGVPTDVFVSYQDVKGNLWGSGHDGHTILWKDGKTTRLEGFTTANVFRALEDPEGSIWLGTAKTGLFRATSAVIATATPQNAASPDLNVIESVLEDRSGGIWYGSRGLFQLSNGRSRVFYHPGEAVRPTDAGAAQALHNIICALYQDQDGTIWAGSRDGVARVSGSVLVSDGPTADIRGRVYAIYRDRAGDLWIGGERGLYRLRGETLTHFTPNDGLGSDAIQVIREGRNGALWIGTGAGLFLHTGSAFSPVAPAQGPDVQNITALYEDEAGVLWIGTHGVGLYRLEREKLTHYTGSSGLSTNNVFQILEDGKGYFWLSSYNGLHRVKKEDLNAFAAGRRPSVTSTRFGRTDGMRSTECSSPGQPTGIKARDGKLWFPTSGGLAVLDPEAVEVNVHPPPVLIEDALVDGHGHTETGAASLTPGQLSLDIQYTALSFIKSNQIRFRYRMEGLDPDWIEAGTRRTAYYTRIPSGKYTFHVTAANSDGVWNTEGAQLEVSVQPPFYRTWWFAVAVSLAAVMSIGIAWRYRVSQLERAQALQQAFSRQLIASQEEERKRIAAELHDSLGQSLLIIKNQATLGLMNSEDSPGARDQFDHIVDSASHSIEEVRQIARNLRPHHLDRLGLTQAIEAMIESVADATPIHLTSEIIPIDGVFPKDAEITVFRIIQESLNNILKHSQATDAKIAIGRDSREVTITIEDNGRGFTPQDPHSSQPGGFGLTGIAERVKILGGEHAIESSLGHGARITVRLRSNGLEEAGRNGH
jgi:signal transduction histidine kinase/ligand-binding sensor domain-containing protein